mgnify:CR=1 FL=1
MHEWCRHGGIDNDGGVCSVRGIYRVSWTKAMIDPRAYPYIAVVILIVAVACAIMIRDIIRDIMADKKRGLR